MTPRASTWASFGNAQFRWLYASNMAFFLAMNGQAVVRSWLAFELTRSEFALGQITAAIALPMLVVAPLGGVIADRVERRALIALGQAVVLLSEICIVTLLMLGRLEFWHMLAATLVMGFAFPFIMPARQAIVVNIVGREGLANAMALNMGGMNATRVLGLFSGFLIEPLGVECAYLAGVIVYAVALVSLRGVRPHPPDWSRRAPILQNLVEGVVYLVRARAVFLLLVFGLLPMFLAMPFQQLLVSFAERVWDAGPRGYTLMSAVAGLGGLAGSLYVARRSNQPARMRTMLVSILAFAGCLVLFTQSPGMWIALLPLFLASAGSSVFGTLNNTAIQLLIPEHVRGRVSSFLMMSFSLPLLGTLPVGRAAETFGPRAALGGAALAAIASVLAFYALSPTLRGVDREVSSALEQDATQAVG